MNYRRILPFFAALSLVLSACGQAPQGGGSTLPDGAASGTGEVRPAGAVLTCRIVDGAADGRLLLADLDGTANGVYTLPVGEIPVTVEGKNAAAEDLADGMTLEVEYSGDVLETYPAQLANVSALRAQTAPDGRLADLCGLYLRVLDDLWAVDAGLNGMEDGGTVPYVGVDLSGAPGELTAAEKSAIIWQFGQAHGVTPLTGTFDELAEQGYIDREGLYWKDGVLFSIKENYGHDTECYSLPVLHFDAQKWRSGLGAYFFSDCTAVWPESGPWTDYTVGSEAIS
ncbi:hypothetical protein [Oscillibacter ruminantium]|uniref:hypothetical protein n=1 Tax=Oscillibacter ruminantium TaxID=1263547 RepID=UPI0033205374